MNKKDCVLLKMYGDGEKFLSPVWFSCGKCNKCDRMPTYENHRSENKRGYMDKRIIILFVAILGALIVINIYDKNTESTNVTQNLNNSQIERATPQNPDFNWNAFWFNDSRCNENSTKSHYEPRKIDGQWSNIEVLTCLNQTVRIVPV